MGRAVPTIPLITLLEGECQKPLVKSFLAMTPATAALAGSSKILPLRLTLTLTNGSMRRARFESKSLLR